LMIRTSLSSFALTYCSGSVDRSIFVFEGRDGSESVRMENSPLQNIFKMGLTGLANL
jgi:hypothetical protein